MLRHLFLWVQIKTGIYTGMEWFLLDTFDICGKP